MPTDSRVAISHSGVIVSVVPTEGRAVTDARTTRSERRQSPVPPSHAGRPPGWSRGRRAALAALGSAAALALAGCSTGSTGSTGEAHGEASLQLPDLGSVNIICLLYTSDAADEEDSVDLGGRRI